MDISDNLIAVLVAIGIALVMYTVALGSYIEYKNYYQPDSKWRVSNYFWAALFFFWPVFFLVQYLIRRWKSWKENKNAVRAGRE